MADREYVIVYEFIECAPCQQRSTGWRVVRLGALQDAALPLICNDVFGMCNSQVTVKRTVQHG